MNKILLICFLIETTLACNNYCSGHGKCGSQDKCKCFMGWGGADCSLRSCPYDDAFVDLPLGDINHNRKVDKDDAKDEWRPNGGIAEDLSNYVTSTRAHRYAECSNAGLCDRSSGECVCFDGYEGSACQRRSCPNVDGKVCSGHGSCLTSTTIIHDAGGSYYGWESEKYLSCVCDKEWEGIDCSMKKCPKGVDPVSTNAISEFVYAYKLANKIDNKPLVITYDDTVYTTLPVKLTNDGFANGCDSTTGVLDNGLISKHSEELENIRTALSNTPLSRGTVTIGCKLSGSGSDKYETTAQLVISLPPTDYASFEKSKVKVCDDVDCTTTTTDEFSHIPKKTDKAPTEYLCSRRGLCKSDTGECECFDGYSGEACQRQRAISL